MCKRLAFAALLLGACHTGDVDPMEQQPKLQEYEETRHFDDSMAMRYLVEGTVPRERDLTGPPEITAQLLEQGHEKFNQMCTPCHGFIGDGKGSVAHQFSLRQPPSLHDARRSSLAPEYIYRVITEGFGLMPRFTTQLDAHERWSVVAYVKALQHSQNIHADSLPADLRDALEHPKPKKHAEGESAAEEKKEENEPVEVKHGGAAMPEEGPGTPGALKGAESGAMPPPVREEAR
jgi:mono/diheme cytochrome c family protein